jgi:MerR family copper efflux transcriptional regulator
MTTLPLRESTLARMSEQHMQIGEVAERTSLSLRTIRYYEEVGLVPPSARSQGGFRLYTDDDVERLLLVRSMKPLDFSIEQMRELLSLLDQLESAPADGEHTRQLVDRLSLYRGIAEQRIAALSAQLTSAQAFAADLRAREQSPQSARGHARS